jgi:WD40 repeat protein
MAIDSADHEVWLWDPIIGTSFGNPLTGHTDKVWAVAFGKSPDGRLLLATGSADGTVRLWDPVDPTSAALHTYTLQPSIPQALSFEQTRIYVGCSDGIIAIQMPDDLCDSA